MIQPLLSVISKPKPPHRVFYFLLFTLHASLFTFHSASAAEAKHAMVATADPHATQAALEVLQRGGNAVDAAIAAQWVLNVVEPQGSGIGGGAFFLYYDAASKKVYAFDGREAAPGAAFPEMFQDPQTGQPYPYYPDRITGGLSVGVPGVLRMMETVHRRFGSNKYSFKELFTPAIQIAERGFTVTPRLAKHILQEQERIARFDATAKIFFNSRNEPLRTGDVLIQRDLAATFRLIQTQGPDVFYFGEIGKDIVQTVRHAAYHPGLMELEDLKRYQAMERMPLTGSYRGYSIFGMPPPSSGGTALLESLNILEAWDLVSLNRSWKFYHLFAEAQAIAFDDRAAYLGDPAYSKIPLDELTSKSYAKKRAEGLRMDRARSSLAFKARNLAQEGTHTTHISIADDRGNLVAMTTTIESVFGSGLVVPGRGFVLNNELTDFDAEQKSIDHGPQTIAKAKSTNHGLWTMDYGLLHPNAPESDKRPRSSMTPTLIFKDGNPVMVLGSPGGSTIISSVLNILVNVIDFGMPLEMAMQQPKLMHRGEKIEVEPGLFLNQKLMTRLRQLGHDVMQCAVYGNAQAVYFDRLRSVWVGASDPRGEGQAAGF